MTKRKLSARERLEETAQDLRTEHQRLTAKIDALVTQFETLTKERAEVEHQLVHTEAALTPVQAVQPLEDVIADDGEPGLVPLPESFHDDDVFGGEA